MTVGYPHEVEAFVGRNPAFKAHYERLLNLSNTVFGSERQYSLRKPQILAFALLVSAQEAFQEIVCLAANGFGRGAQARVRTMFENVALAAYFAKYPDETERFIHFQRVERKRELSYARQVFDKPQHAQFSRSIDKHLSELDSNLGATLKRFGKGIARSWHEGMEKIARALNWQHHFFYCYLLPNRFVHASPLVVEQRMSMEDHLRFDAGPDYDQADEAVRSALTLSVLSFAVAQDLGVSVPDTEIDAIRKSLVTAYRNVPNKHRI